MEKKTIGKFISALRRANGMTQRELGDKLFVSDKTVSRWERDECTPELSLIPSIAEIFGITTDELLRGERNNPEREDFSEKAEAQRSKSDKQLRLMLDKSSRKFKNLTLISVGITILALLSATVANLGFSKGLIAFCLAVAFLAASEICQICFTISSRIMSDEDDEYNGKIQGSNTGMVKTTVTLTFINIASLSFCLPLVTLIDGANFGLTFEAWLVYGVLFAAVSFVIAYVLYVLCVKNYLCKKGLMILDEVQKNKAKINKKLLKRLVTISVSIAAVLLVCIIVLNNIGIHAFMKKQVFDNCEDFKAFMESEYDKWYKEGYSYVDENGDVICMMPVFDADSEEFPMQEFGRITNSKGEVICEYYYNPDTFYAIVFTETSEDKMPVTVITNQAVYDARNLLDNMQTVLYLLIAVDFTVCAIIYVKRKDKYIL